MRRDGEKRRESRCRHRRRRPPLRRPDFQPPRPHRRPHRLFLHAERLRFAHPINNPKVEIHAPLAEELERVLGNL